MVKVGQIFVIQRCCSSYNGDRHRRNQGPTWQRLSTLRWRCIRCWTGACKGPRMAQEMLQVSRLQQNSRLYHRLRRARQRRLLQDLLRKEMGTARIRIRMWIGILTNRWPNVSNSPLSLVIPKMFRYLELENTWSARVLNSWVCKISDVWVFRVLNTWISRILKIWVSNRSSN